MYQVLFVSVFLFVVVLSMERSEPVTTENSLILGALSSRKTQSESELRLQETSQRKNLSTPLYMEGQVGEPGLQDVILHENITNKQDEISMMNIEDAIDKPVLSYMPSSEQNENQSSPNILNYEITNIPSVTQSSEEKDKQTSLSGENVDELINNSGTQNTLDYDRIYITPGEIQVSDSENIFEHNSLPALDMNYTVSEAVTLSVSNYDDIYIEPESERQFEEVQGEQDVSGPRNPDALSDKEGDLDTPHYEDILGIPDPKSMDHLEETLHEENISLEQGLIDSSVLPNVPTGFEEENIRNPDQKEMLAQEKQDVSPVQLIDDETISGTLSAIDSEEHFNISTLMPNVGLQKVFDKQSSGPAISMVDEEAGRNVTPPVFAGTSESTDAPIVLGIEGLSLPVKSYQTNHSLEEIFARFGTIYGKLLGDNFKRNFSLHDIQTTFQERPGMRGALNGKINFKHGVLQFNASFEMLEVSVTQINEHAVIANYMFKDPRVRMLYKYLIEVPFDNMSGVLLANFQDVEMYAPLIVNKNNNGTCKYLGYLFFYLDQNFKQKRTSTIFRTERRSKVRGRTAKAEKILNTFIIKKDIFRDINTVLSTVPAAEPAVRAEEEYQGLMKKHICDVMI